MFLINRECSEFLQIPPTRIEGYQVTQWKTTAPQRLFVAGEKEIGGFRDVNRFSSTIFILS